MVGGTSIGSLIGGLYCDNCDQETIRKRCRAFSMKMARYFDKILDLTWPTTSMFTGTATINLKKSIINEDSDYSLLFIVLM